jgi:hypothetical protein
MTPITRTPELEAVVAGARQAAREAGELDLPSGPFESPWVPELRAAVVALLEDGTYDEIIRSIAASDPDLA